MHLISALIKTQLRQLSIQIYCGRAGIRRDERKTEAWFARFYDAWP